MAAIPLARSRIPVASDLVFGYTLVAILSQSYLQEVSVEQVPRLLVIGTILASVLGLLQPVEKVLGFWVSRVVSISNKSLVRESFYSSYVDSSRSKVKSSVYLAVIISTLSFLPPAIGPPELWLAILVSGGVAALLVAGWEGLWLVLRTHLVTAYLGLIDESSGKSDDEVMIVLREVRQAFGRGNWGEAARYMHVVGLPEGYELTKSLFGLHKAFVEEIPTKQA